MIWEEPSGPPTTNYDPAPTGPIHAPVPTAPVAPKIVEDPAAKIRIGNFVTDRPNVWLMLMLVFASIYVVLAWRLRL